MSVEPQGYTIHALRRSAMYLPLLRLNNSGLVGWNQASGQRVR